jgi:transcription initiation factor TFIID subunit 4
MTPDTAKVKCKNFLSTLLRLASEQPESVATNVQMLIQGLVDAKVEPEEFTTKLQRELNSSPQPCLIPFLKVFKNCILFEFALYIGLLLVYFGLTEKLALPETIPSFTRVTY